MFYISKKYSVDEFGVMDTTDGVEEVYTVRELTRLMKRFHVNIKGVSLENDKVRIKVINDKNIYCDKYTDYESYVANNPDSCFVFKPYTNSDRIELIDYIPNDEDFRVIEIPPFVTFIDSEAFKKVTQSLKVIYRGGKLKYCSNIFQDYWGTKLDLSEFDITGLGRLDKMFKHCKNLEDINLSNFNTTGVESMNYMFSNCGKLRRLDVSSFDMSNVISMAHMFDGCRSLEELILGDFNTRRAYDMTYMFNGCSSLKSLDLSRLDLNYISDSNCYFRIFRDTPLTLENTGFQTALDNRVFGYRG